MNKRTNTRKSRRPFLSALLKILLIIIAVLLGIITARWLTSPLFNFDRTDSIPMDGFVEDKVFALVAGLDKDETNTDVLMLFCYDQGDRSLRVMSVPRDTYVYFGSDRGLINSAYVRSFTDETGETRRGGIELTALKVKEVTGIPAINYYAVFKVGTFAALIDALDGVEFNVPQDMNYDDPYQDLYIHLTGGFQKLNGHDAENMVRFRHYPMGDLQRVQVQQDLLKALMEQKLNKHYVGRLDDVYRILSDNVTSNLTLKDLMKYGDDALNMSMDNVQSITMPTQLAGDSHLVPDYDAIATVVPEFFGLNTVSDTDGGAQ